MMKITVDISLYPLDQDYIPPIKTFIRRLREFEGLEIVTNQLSTQLRGEYQLVTSALNAAMEETMKSGPKTVFVTKFLNSDLDISRLPHIE